MKKFLFIIFLVPFFANAQTPPDTIAKQKKYQYWSLYDTASVVFKANNGKGTITIPSGTTGQRPGYPLAGALRLNTSLNQLECYINGSWNQFTTGTGGSVTGSGVSNRVALWNTSSDLTSVSGFDWTSSVLNIPGGVKVTANSDIIAQRSTDAGGVYKGFLINSSGGSTLGGIRGSYTDGYVEAGAFLGGGYGLKLYSNSSEFFRAVSGVGNFLNNVYFGSLTTSPFARVHIKSGGGAQQPSLKIDSGALLSTKEAWAIEVGAKTTGKPQIYFTDNSLVQRQMALPDQASNSGKVLTTDGTDASWGPQLNSGTNTPTLTNAINVASSTAFQCQWLQIGSVVTVSGKVTITPTAGSANTVLGMSLPVASGFSGTEAAAGTGNDGANNTLAVLGNTSNNRVDLQFNSNGTSARTYYFHFTYLVTPP